MEKKKKQVGPLYRKLLFPIDTCPEEFIQVISECGTVNDVYLFSFSLFFIFWSPHAACGILVPSPEMELVPTEVEVWSLNPWTISEVPQAFS